MIITGADEDLRRWVSRIIFGDPEGFDDKCTAIGCTVDGKLAAAVVYSDYQPGLSMEMSVASVDKRWASRLHLEAFFAYPFIQLKLKRVTTLCSAKEGDIIQFNKRLGFVPEGYHRQAWFNGDDAVSFGMLRNECKWIKKGNGIGQEIAKAT